MQRHSWPNQPITHSSISFDDENDELDDRVAAAQTPQRLTQSPNPSRPYREASSHPSSRQSRGGDSRPSLGTNAADEDLQRAFHASVQAHEARERTMRRRDEDARAREAADEAAAIAESTRLAATQTSAQRQAAAAAAAEMERMLRDSAAEEERRRARDRANLARRDARFGVSSFRTSDTLRPHAPASPTSSQQDPSSLPRNQVSNPTSSRERPHSTPRDSPPHNSTPPSQERIRNQAEPELLTSGPRSPRYFTPLTAPPRASRPNSPGELLRQGIESARRPSGRVGPAMQQQPRWQFPARLRDMRVEEPDAAVRPLRNSPVTGPNPMGRRNSERFPHIERQPMQRASSSSSRREAMRNMNFNGMDVAMRQAMNHSARHAQLQHGRGNYSRREEEQLRIAMQNSLGDAPPPVEPTEGLADPPPGYDVFHKDKKVDPLRFTTTNEKGDEPGYMRRITPEVLEIMKRFLIQQQEFDAKTKASGNGVPPANNAMAKQQKRAPTAPSPAAGSDSSLDPAESLEALLGTRLPAPSSRPRAALVTPAASAFVSRMPDLASDAQERIPQSRPWENAFSTIPNRRTRSGRR